MHLSLHDTLPRIAERYRAADADADANVCRAVAACFIAAGICFAAAILSAL